MSSIKKTTTKSSSPDKKKPISPKIKASKMNRINFNDNICTDFDSTSPNSPKKMSPKNKKDVLTPNSIKLQEKKKGNQKVKFKKNFVQIVPVESWKKYNLEHSNSEPFEKDDKVHCRCLIF